MKRFFQLFGFAAALGCAATAQDGSDPIAAARSDRFALGVAISEKGAAPDFHVSGPVRSGSNDEVSADAAWHIGSITKSFTATLVMQQVERGVLDLDAPIGTYVADAMDPSWQALGSARREGLPFYHGEILNEATEHNLDLSPFQVLVAATDNEAYNTLVCNEFAHEMGRDSVYQLGESADGDDKHALPLSLRGRALFESGYGVDEVNDKQKQGWVFKKTKLSEEFDFEDAQLKLPDTGTMLLLVRKSGTLRFFTHAARPEPRAGDTIVSFTPPQIRTNTKEDTDPKATEVRPRPQAT